MALGPWTEVAVNLDDALDEIEIGRYEDRVEAAKVLRAAIERVRELCENPSAWAYTDGPSAEDVERALDGGS